MSIKVWVHVSVILNQCNASCWRWIKIRIYICLSTGFIWHDYNKITDYSLQSLTLAMSKSNGWSISEDFLATSASLTIKHSVKDYSSPNKMGRKNRNLSRVGPWKIIPTNPKVFLWFPTEKIPRIFSVRFVRSLFLLKPFFNPIEGFFSSKLREKLFFLGVHFGVNFNK